jgi:preprotein translocase subunit SecD
LSAWCRRYQNGENIAFVLDGKVLSIAPVKEGVVLSNEAFIDGVFPTKETALLCDLIKNGALPVELKVLKSQKTGK